MSDANCCLTSYQFSIGIYCTTSLLSNSNWINTAILLQLAFVLMKRPIKYILHNTFMLFLGKIQMNALSELSDCAPICGEWVSGKRGFIFADIESFSLWSQKFISNACHIKFQLIFIHWNHLTFSSVFS